MANGNQSEAEQPDALSVRGGTAWFLAPGNVPIIVDREGVSQIVGDLIKQPSE